MTDKVNNIYLLRNLNAAYNALTPSDKMLVFQEVTLDSDVEAVIDTSTWLAPGAVIDYWFLNRTIAHNGNSSTTAGSATILSGQIVVDTGASIIGGVSGSGNAIPASGVTVMVALIVNQRDLLLG